MTKEQLEQLYNLKLAATYKRDELAKDMNTSFEADFEYRKADKAYDDAVITYSAAVNQYLAQNPEAIS